MFQERESTGKGLAGKNNFCMEDFDETENGL
jgi:hypothetical protein